MHTCIHACMHAYIHTYIHTYTHTHRHTYIRTYIHTYIKTTFIPRPPLRPPSPPPTTSMFWCHLGQPFGFRLAQVWAISWGFLEAPRAPKGPPRGGPKHMTKATSCMMYPPMHVPLYRYMHLFWRHLGLCLSIDVCVCMHACVHVYILCG